MIESILTDYLRDNRRVVIPGLGAFLRKEGGELVFASFLNKDDGVLTALIGRAYGVSEAEAGEIIGQYVASVGQALADRGFYDLPGLGRLEREANGTLRLDQNARPEEAPTPAPTPVAVPTPEPAPVAAAPRPEPVRILDPAPVATAPSPEPTEPEIVAAPKTLYDRLLEQREQQAPAASEPRPIVRHTPNVSREPHHPTPAAAPPSRSAAAPRPTVHRPASAPIHASRKTDWLLIVAIVVAIIAVAVMVYAYSVDGRPPFELNG